MLESWVKVFAYIYIFYFIFSLCVSIHEKPKHAYVSCEGVSPEVHNQLLLGAHTRLAARYINEIKLKSRSKYMDF